MKDLFLKNWVAEGAACDVNDFTGHGSKVNIESWLSLVGRKGCQKWSENDSLHWLSRHGESNDALGTRGYETITMQNDSLCEPIC